MTTSEKAESMMSRSFEVARVPNEVPKVNYENPPILEAVVQVSFEAPIELSKIEKASQKLSKNYFSSNERLQLTTAIDGVSGHAFVNNRKIGFELRDGEATKVAVLEERSEEHTSELQSPC